MSFGNPVNAVVRNFTANLGQATSISLGGQSVHLIIQNRSASVVPVHFDSSSAYSIPATTTLTIPNVNVRVLTFGEPPVPAAYIKPTTQVSPGGLVASGQAGTYANLTTIASVSVIAAVASE